MERKENAPEKRKEWKRRNQGMNLNHGERKQAWVKEEKKMRPKSSNRIAGLFFLSIFCPKLRPITLHLERHRSFLCRCLPPHPPPGIATILPADARLKTTSFPRPRAWLLLYGGLAGPAWAPASMRTPNLCASALKPVRLGHFQVRLCLTTSYR